MGRPRSEKYQPYEEQGDRLREIRRAWLDGEYNRPGGQEDFAENVLGLPFKRWNAYERGSEKIPDDAIAKLKKETGVSSDYIKWGDAAGNGPALQRALAKHRAKAS